MSNPSVLNRCTVQKGSGDFCDVRSLTDSPFPICRHHAQQIYRHYHANIDSKTMALVMALNGSADKAAEAAQDYNLRQDARKQATDEQSVVYYARIGDYIKIGTTTNLRARLAGLRIDADAILATEPGSYELERERHREFAPERLGRRENFKPSVRLLAHIDTILAEHGEPVFTTYAPASV